MKSSNLEIGRWGETISRRYLQSKGYKIIEQNYRTRYAEIDLVAWDRKTLVFVEIRTKAVENFGSPEESFNRDKIARLVRSAQVYAAMNDYSKGCRIDAICIVLKQNREIKRLTHYKSIV